MCVCEGEGGGGSQKNGEGKYIPVKWCIFMFNQFLEIILEIIFRDFIRSTELPI